MSQVIIVTKIDKVCCHVEGDVSKVFQSSVIKDLVDKVADMFGISRSHVLPVKNYEKEIDTQNDVSILALRTMRQILRATDDVMFNLADETEVKKSEADATE